MKKTLFFAVILFAVSLLYAQDNVQRHALIIGNAEYTNFGALQNPINDANDMTQVLQEMGFNVDVVRNGSLTDMENATIRLKNRLIAGGSDSYGLFYYAGHAVQVDGQNYLIPTNANIPDRSLLRERAFPMQAMLDMLNEANNSLNIIVLDACRDFPAAWSRSLSTGLSNVSRQPADSIVVYATAAGSVALDGSGRNGFFTEHLLNNLRKPGLEVTEIFRLTMGDVTRASNNQQRPAIYNQFPGTAYLDSRSIEGGSVTTQQPAAISQAAPIQQYEAGPAPEGFINIRGGTYTMGAPANEPMRRAQEVQRQITLSSFYMGRTEVTQSEYEAVMGKNPSRFKGSDLPVEKVSWLDAVEYCNKRSELEGLTPAYTINGRNVSWNREANGYRLPTEAEWEYACRAGTTTTFFTGNNITTNQANYNGQIPYHDNPKGRFRERTTGVASFQPNAWGLYDMHGNVWEWCWDWFGDYSFFDLTDPIGVSYGRNKVIRGGSWDENGRNARSANRKNQPPTKRHKSIGFRVARNIEG